MGDPLCWDWKERGGLCPRGNWCKYQHGADDNVRERLAAARQAEREQMASMPPIAPRPPPLNRGEMIVVDPLDGEPVSIWTLPSAIMANPIPAPQPAFRATVPPRKEQSRLIAPRLPPGMEPPAPVA